MAQDLALVDKETGEIIEHKAQPLSISPQFIAEQQKSLVLLQQLTQNVLVIGRDYGHIPGIAGMGLWDPGAQMIIGAFNCYVGPRRIISLTNTDEKIAVVVEVPLISNVTGREVGSGIGAASTLEVKHKYRWIATPSEWGYDTEAAKVLKQKTEEGRTLYRIPNPEVSELLNIIVKQASKRAEVDAAQGLPGTASALRELFDPRLRKGGPPPRKDPDWAGFWGRVAQMGLAEADVHAMLGVKSIKEWLEQGKDLDEAFKTLARKMADRAAATAAAAGGAGPVGTPDGALDDVQATKDEINALGTRIMAKKGYSQPATVMGYIESVTHKAELWTRSDLEKVKKDAGLS